MLKDIDIATIRDHFGCSSWTVSDIYVLGAKNSLNKRLADIAFGSIVHTVQDSFAAGHAERKVPDLNEYCSDSLHVPKPGSIVEFHAYGQQDGHKHDLRDSRTAMTEAARSRSNAIDATRQLFSYWNDNAKWKDVQAYFQCVFALSADSRPSSAGAQLARTPA
jgi:hypothetical protein